jgi:fructokinase
VILCCGEALIDMIPALSSSGQPAFVPHSGGAVFNTAIALGRLGVETGLISGVSRDLFGQQLETSLRASNVDTSFLLRSDRPTTLAFVTLTGGHARYTFYDENSAGRMIRETDMPKLQPDVLALFFGGISLCSDPAASAYEGLCLRAARDRVVMLDPNIRPGFIQDESAYRTRLEQMLRAADIVKVSDEDLAWIFPDLSGQDDRISDLRDMGPALVLVTEGEDGATAYDAHGSKVHLAALPVRVVDTVGAGDTFNAGILAKLSELGCLTKDGVRSLSAAQIHALVSHGARVAAITVSRAGANAPWASEI